MLTCCNPNVIWKQYQLVGAQFDNRVNNAASPEGLTDMTTIQQLAYTFGTHQNTRHASDNRETMKRQTSITGQNK